LPILRFRLTRHRHGRACPPQDLSQQKKRLADALLLRWTDFRNVMGQNPLEPPKLHHPKLRDSSTAFFFPLQNVGNV
jgi:hypothetical protein